MWDFCTTSRKYTHIQSYSLPVAKLYCLASLLHRTCVICKCLSTVSHDRPVPQLHSVACGWLLYMVNLAEGALGRSFLQHQILQPKAVLLGNSNPEHHHRSLRRTRMATGVASVLSGSASESSVPYSACAVALSAHFPGRSFLLRVLHVIQLSLSAKPRRPRCTEAKVHEVTMRAVLYTDTSLSCLLHNHCPPSKSIWVSLSGR